MVFKLVIYSTSRSPSFFPGHLPGVWRNIYGNKLLFFVVILSFIIWVSAKNSECREKIFFLPYTLKNYNKELAELSVELWALRMKGWKYK